MYLTYTEYQAMGGKALSETAFTELEIEAEVTINYVTFNRLINDQVVDNRVKRLTKRIIDLVQKKAEASKLGNEVRNESDSTGTYITSQANDGVSVTYGGMQAVDLFDSCKSEIRQMTNHYLNGVKNDLGQLVLYRGLYPGE